MQPCEYHNDLSIRIGSHSTESADIPDFQTTKPWGSFLPPIHVRISLSIAHFLPNSLRSLNKLLRRTVKYHFKSPIDLEIWDLRLRLAPRGNLSEQKLYSSPRLFDRVELQMLRQKLTTDSIFVDVGANAGIYSFWASKCMEGQGRVIAIEPDPIMQERIEFNCNTNGIHNIELCPYALSDHEGVSDLFVLSEQRGQNTLDKTEAVYEQKSRERLQVKVTTLLDLLTLKKISSIDVLKIDIEGHELVVLRHFFHHAPQHFWPGAIITEIKPQIATALHKLLKCNGYTIKRKTPLNAIYERQKSY